MNLSILACDATIGNRHLLDLVLSSRFFVMTAGGLQEQGSWGEWLIYTFPFTLFPISAPLVPLTTSY
jgi:hypothetical protein